jgi:hypothetical protein
MILIYVSNITPRVEYIFNVIFREILKITFKLTNDKEVYLKYQGPKFTYGKHKIDNELSFGSSGLLFETGINKQDIKWETWNGLKIFFRVDSSHELPFDIFSASFFMISRYQEYLPHTKDRHGRFSPEESSGYNEKVLEIPIVNLWVKELKLILQKAFPDMDFPNNAFTFTPTIDIDNAYAFKHKGFSRTFLSLLNNLIHLQFRRLSRRINVLLGYDKDPYDSYRDQFRISNDHKLKPYYFILLGNYGKYDRNHSHKNSSYISLIRTLNENGEICLHPSYGSNRSIEQLKIEKERLEKIIGRKITKSRQHYLKINIPHTYRKLIEVGIKEDYSMGYASKVGFRAGTCTPYYFYDVEDEKQTDLKIFPFAFMDTTLKTHLKIRSKEVIPYVKPLVEEIRSVGGHLVFIFHNESIGNAGNWKRWGDLYEKIIKLSLGK